MDFETRFMITRWAIRGFGLVLMLGVIPSVLFMTLQAWRRLLQAWRTKRPSAGEPDVQVEVLMPTPSALAGGITAALRETLAPTPHLPAQPTAPQSALPAPQEPPLSSSQRR